MPNQPDQVHGEVLRVYGGGPHPWLGPGPRRCLIRPRAHAITDQTKNPFLPSTHFILCRCVSILKGSLNAAVSKSFWWRKRMFFSGQGSVKVLQESRNFPNHQKWSNWPRNICEHGSVDLQIRYRNWMTALGTNLFDLHELDAQVSNPICS